MDPKLLALVPLLACAGCLARDISRKIDALECDESTGACPTTGGDTTGGDPGDEDTTLPPVMTTTPGSAASDSETTDTTGETAGETSGDTGATSTGDTTGEPAPVCGDGVVQADGPEPEDCDDANDDPADGCNHCGRDRLVFVTSMEFSGGSFKGLDGADQRCRSLAAQAGLPNFAGFKAWLSDSQTDARDRMFRGRGRYVLVNGLVVVDSWDALLAGELQNGINVTELSETKDYFAWTGTNPDGTGVAGADHCADWTGDLFANEGHWGNTKAVTAEWTLAVSMVDQPQGCAGDLALYCFEQE
jgi:cysteine-rich repeat protein